MGSPDEETKYEGEVVEKSNSGNPVIKRGEWDKKVVVITTETSVNRGETIEFFIQKEHGDHYAAVPSGKAPVSNPGYNSSPNIPIHHDGKSVGSSRSEKKASESVGDREFNPKTHGAPELESEKRSRKHLRTSGK
jgi:hypothetical protein